MRTVDSPARGWRARLAELAVLILVLQALSLPAGWSQESGQPEFDEEIAKQEQIYRKGGAEGRRSYTVDRGLAKYAESLPAGFCDALGRLSRSDRWLDIGAGQGEAVLDYYAGEAAAAAGEKCGGSGGARARAVAISIEDRRTGRWKQREASLGGDRIRYLFGKRLRQYSPEELGKFQLVTDVYGGFTYTEDLSRFMETVLGLLEIGGGFYTLATGVHLENGKDKPGSLYLTELEDAFGRRVKLCSWLKKISCAEVSCESKSDWDRPTELIAVRKVCSDASVPRTKLLEFEAGYPPGRRFQLDLE